MNRINTWYICIVQLKEYYDETKMRDTDQAVYGIGSIVSDVLDRVKDIHILVNSE